jgi:hypothetical protein
VLSALKSRAFRSRMHLQKQTGIQKGNRTNTP